MRLSTAWCNAKAVDFRVKSTYAQMSEADSEARISVNVVYWGVSPGNMWGSGEVCQGRKVSTFLIKSKSVSRDQPLHVPGELGARGEQA